MKIDDHLFKCPFCLRGISFEEVTTVTLAKSGASNPVYSSRGKTYRCMNCGRIANFETIKESNKKNE